MPPRLYPSTDLHLLVGAVVPLRAFMSINTPGVWTDLSTVSGFAMGLLPNTGGIVTMAARQVTAQSVGIQPATLRIGFAGLSINVAFRATVHHRMNQIVLPSAGFTMEVDRDDRVLTVYAQFETAGGVLSTHDVTGLPYLRYSVTTTGAAVVSVDANGRVSTIGSGAGTATVEVSLDPALAGTTPPTVGTLQITVVDAVTDRPILEIIHAGTAIRKRSIVVVAEGFTSTQKAAFDEIARRIATRMLEVSPYNLLRESFDMYSAFVPSQDDGVTLAMPVIPLNGSADIAVPVPPDRSLVAEIDFLVEELLMVVGNPTNPAVAATTRTAAQAALRTNIPGTNTVDLSQSTFDIWRSLGTAVPVEARVRESFFGFQIGERHFSTAFAHRDTTPAMIPDVPLDFWRPRDTNRTPFIDERRLPDLTVPGADPKTAHVAAQNRFLGALRPPGGPMGFGMTWVTGGENFGLVVFLINSDHYAGVRRDNHLAMSIGGGIVVATAPSLLAPGLIDVEAVPRPINFWSEAHRQGFRDAPSDVLVDTMAHELAHSLPLGNLGDEYSGAPAAPTTPAAQAFAEDAPNTQLLANARTGTTIDPLRLKWNWERVEAAVHVEALSGSGTQLAITTIAEDMVRWPFDTVGRVGFLRHKDLRSTSSPKGTGLTIRSVDIAANVIHVDLPSSGSAAALITLFSTGSTFVMPQVDATSTPVTLVQPEAIAEMVTGPFAQSSHPGCVLNADQGPPAPLGTFWNRMQYLGAYESAAQFNCGVIRPAGECKMRKTAAVRTDKPVDFCFVCKYAIVEAVDCAVHALLDREYPR